MNSPLVSVVMPVYNAEKYLNEAIDSILNQTFTDFEFIILNDGSSDGSDAVISSYDDNRIHYVKNSKNLRLASTLNKGISLAKGCYIARMDADDVSLPSRLETQLDYMKLNPDIVVCGSNVKTFGYNERIYNYPTSHNDICCQMLFGSPLAHPSTIFRRDVLLRNRMHYDSDRRRAEDYEFWIRLSKSYKLANINKVLLRYRVYNPETIQKRNDVLKASDEIRRNLLANVGVCLTEEKADLHSKVVSGVYETSEVFLIQVGEWFSEILEANNKSEIYNPHALTSALARKWLDICKNASFLGLVAWRIYINQPLAKQIRLTRRSKYIFQLRCLLRYSVEDDARLLAVKSLLIER